jgi:outer membrane protein assembly factor BamB
MVFLMAVIATTPVATLVMTSQQGTTQLPTATTQEPQVARAPTPQKEWNYTTGDIIVSSPAVSEEVVYIGSNDKNVYARFAS